MTAKTERLQTYLEKLIALYIITNICVILYVMWFIIDGEKNIPEDQEDFDDDFIEKPNELYPF